MKEMTNNQIDQRLAEFMGKDSITTAYCNDRNDLADVLRKLTPEQWLKVAERINNVWFSTSTDSPGHGATWWLLTCDTAIIARAVAEVVG